VKVALEYALHRMGFADLVSVRNKNRARLRFDLSLLFALTEK
jgi:hypothetical protein